MLLAVVATVLGLSQTAWAAYDVTPAGPAWVPDGAVDAVATSGSTVYVGGAFTGGYAALDAGSGRLLWRGDANGAVRALALAGDGNHLLLGGDFTSVGGATHRKLASVDLADGNVNGSYRGTAGGSVRDIVVVGGTEYFAGAFTQHGGMSQQGLGAVDAGSGTVVPSFTASANGNVYALATDGTRLFVGGQFTAVNGQARNELASVTLPDTLDGWAPARACSKCNLVWDMTLDSARNRLYTVGRNGGFLYTLDTTTGAQIYRGDANGDSQAITLGPDGLVYVGGHFTSVTIGGVTTTRTIVAAFDVTGSTPVVAPFAARFVTTYPGVWAMASTPGTLYVGGYFTAAGPKVGGQNEHPYLAFFPEAGSTGGGGGTTAPTFSKGTPADNATGIAPYTNVTARFSEKVQNVGSSTFTLTPTTGGIPVPASYSSNSAGTAWTLNPTGHLAAGTWYTVTLTGGITDTSGTPLAAAPVTWQFQTKGTTATAPTFSKGTPADNATGIAPYTNVTARFSEKVQNVGSSTFTLTPTAGGTTVPATYSSNSAGTAWTLNPTGHLARNTWYTVTLTGGITDTSGTPLASAPVTWQFQTTP